MSGVRDVQLTLQVPATENFGDTESISNLLLPWPVALPGHQEISVSISISITVLSLI